MAESLSCAVVCSEDQYRTGKESASAYTAASNTILEHTLTHIAIWKRKLLSAFGKIRGET